MGLVDPSEAHSRDSTPHVHELADSPLREAYEKYDKNKSGMIEVDELKAVFSDLGLLVSSRRRQRPDGSSAMGPPDGWGGGSSCCGLHSPCHASLSGRHTRNGSGPRAQKL